MCERASCCNVDVGMPRPPIIDVDTRTRVTRKRRCFVLAVLPLTTLFIYERLKMENPAKLHLPRGGVCGWQIKGLLHHVREAPKKETLTLSRDTSILGSEVAARSVWYC